MFLHIGGNKVVLLEELIGLFNTDLKDSKTNKEFLEASISSKEFPNYKKANSFIVSKDQVYLSPISPSTLKNRIKKNKIVAEG